MKRFVFLILFLSFAICAGLYFRQPKKVLYIYGWYDLLPKAVIEQFEKETGIKIVFDAFDNNDVLETRLLMGKTGYDLISPTAVPYFSRMVQFNLLAKLDLKKIPNYSNIDPKILAKFRSADPTLSYGIPYGYGTYGILFNEEKVKAIDPNYTIDSYGVFLDPKIAQKFSRYGLSLLEEVFDVFPMALLYLGIDPNTDDEKDIKNGFLALGRIRPYIKRFTSFSFQNDLMIEEVIIAQAPGQEANRTIKSAIELGIKLKFVVPKEETRVYMDTWAIPIDALHKDEAHMFINFVLRPEIAAIITNETTLPNAVMGSRKFIDEELLNNKTLFLENFDNFEMAKQRSRSVQKMITQLWAQVILGR